MNSLRKLATIFLATVLAAFAASANAAAPSKIYSMVVSPIGSTPVAVTIRNETPSGNSTINSFVIQRPAGVTLTLDSSPAARASRPADVQLGADGNVWVKSFDGMKSGNQTPKDLTVYMYAAYGAGAPTCSTGYTWKALVYTGNSFGQEQFDQVDATTKQLAVPANSGVTQTTNCKYTLGMSPGSATVGTSTALTATFGNAADSVASISAVKVTVPANVSVSAVTIATSGTTATITGVPAAGGTDISVTGISPPIAAGGSLALSVQTTIPCGATSPANWGSSVTGFTLSGSNPSTTLNGPCTLTFVTAPANVVTGNAFTVKVGALDGAGNVIGNFADTLGVSLTGPSTLTSTGTQSASGGVVAVKDIIITGVGGPNTLTFTSSFGGASLSLNSLFTVFAGGPLECEPGIPYTFNASVGGAGTDITKSGYAQGQRGMFNKDGSQCIAVGYTFTNNILSTDPLVKNSATLRWDTTSQPNAAFVYTLTFIDESVNASTGTPTSRTKVAWEFNADGTPKYKVYAVACISPNLPAPYGTLKTTLSGTSNADIVIQIDGTALPVGSGVTFPIAIGPAPTGSNTIERLQATWQSGTATSSMYLVKRMQGGTPLAAHAIGAPVMSTPLPIDPNQFMPDGSTTNPYWKKQASMCIADEGWVVVPGGVRFTTTVFDVGDGFVNRDL